jgi:hypothetical protein
MLTPFSRFGLFAFLVLVLFGIATDAFSQASTQPASKSENLDKTEKMDVRPVTVQDGMRVKFDETTPGVVYVETNGERIRVDTTKKSVERLAFAPKPDAGEEKPAADTSANGQIEAAQEESAYDFDKGDEPYDYRLINVPTPKSVPKGSWNIGFTHRFTQPVHPLSESGKNLIGLDSFGVASFGITYGITDKLSVTAYRSPLCQRGLCRTIEVGFAYSFLEQDKRSRWALSAYGSMEGNENFTQEYTYNLQARLSFRAQKRVYLFFSPAVHLNSNGQGRFDPRANEFFPPATVANTFHLPTHGASYGFGTSVLITPNLLALFEFTPRTGFMLGSVIPIRGPGFTVTGFRNESEPEIGFGIQRNVGKHSFSLTFTNTQTTTTSRYNSSNLTYPPQRLVIGFNLARRF